MSLSDVVGSLNVGSTATAGLLIFLLAFAVVALRVIFGRNRPEWKEASRLPLEEDAR